MPFLPVPKNGGTATAAFLAVTLTFAGGLFIFANPITVSLAEIQAEAEEKNPDRNRHYVTFPIEMTANASRLGATLNLEIGLAVREESVVEIKNLLRINSEQLVPSVTEAIRLLIEDPTITDVETFQTEFPGFARDALNRSLATEDIPEPVLEVLILRLIAVT
ncbi:hypothetical protein [Thalassovita aquimarina]|uniref:Flagellar protein FliL n=1 Tax=Thalassovita aquimarina TaxID=2785917 RepID=A0ABS5HL79_9RHOB|nr:hypothetical protein [Thalassovita aquimarina]MBR9649642.1 hypothetical protein [Thalassovita aquimarina]